MPNDNVRITFDGLLLFCFSRKTSMRQPDKRSRCEIGILNRTGADKHEFVIKVEKVPLSGGAPVRVNPKDAGMRENPLKLSQSELRKFSSFHLYTGSLNQQPPKSGSVIREPNFDSVLDLEGEDFYRGKVSVVPGRYTLLLATTGSFAGIGATADEEFARVSRKVLNRIMKTFKRPENWDRLLDRDKRLLASFARTVKTEIEIGKGEYLILKGVRKSGKVETIFSLPDPAEINAKRYVIEINNLDTKNKKHSKNNKDIISNCAAFVYHSLAVNPSHRDGKYLAGNPSYPDSKPKYGLTGNFDFKNLTEDKVNYELQRTDPACCDPCELRLSTSISPKGKNDIKRPAKKKTAKKPTTKKGKPKK